MHSSLWTLRVFRLRLRPAWLKRVINFLIVPIYSMQPSGRGLEKVRKQVIGYNGKKLRVDIYQEKGSANELRPSVVVCHGGGFWMRPRPDYIRHYREMVRETGARVIVVDYTVSLQAPYPAAVEDCYLTAVWAHGNAEELRIDPARIALYGDSCGGALATAVAQMLRDRGQFQPCLQMLIYPLTDDTLSSESARKYTHTLVWNTRMSSDGKDLYLRGWEGPVPAYAFPANATDLSGLPPTYIEVVEYDSLRDEGIAYAERLQAAGVQVELHEVKEAPHAFDLVWNSPITKEARERRMVALKRIFKTDPSQ